MTATLGHEPAYYSLRNIQLDERGTLKIDAESQWGFDIKTITASHVTSDWADHGLEVPIVDRPVIVERRTWIGSNSILYNCIIHEGAIVTVGTVVRTQEVMPWTMVGGNPARVIARFIDGEWEYVGHKWEVLR